MVGGAYLGQYSGITAQTVDQLIQSESQPMLLMKQQIQTIQSKETAWEDIRSRLNNLLNKVSTLQSPATYTSKVTNSSNPNIATISGDSTASEGSHDLVVKQLATNSKLTGSRVDVKSSKDALGFTGTLKLSLEYQGTLDKDGQPIKDSQGNVLTIPNDQAINTVNPKASLDIDIDDKDSLSSIVDKINSQTKDTNINASLVDNHLILKSTTAGNYTIKTDGDAVNKLGLASEGIKSTQGQAAIFSIDGLETIRNSNSITDVLAGATITLTGVSQSVSTTDNTQQPTTISLKNDDTKFQNAVTDFVSQYNSLMGLVNSDLAVGDPSKSDNKVGILAGDSDLVQLQSQLQRMVTSTNVPGLEKGNDGKILTASRVGLSFVDKQGTLGLDTTTFQKALKDDPRAVKDFFYKADISPITGTASNERGYAPMLSKFANSYLTGSNAVITTKTTTFDNTIKDLNSQIDSFQTRLDGRRQQYIAQFTALDSFMMQAQAQMNYFTQQLGINTNNKQQ